MRENARFTHVMTNFGRDVRGKRFSTHADVGRFPMTRFFFFAPPRFPWPGMSERPGVNKKMETISDLRFSAPLGARTLDPNIKSVVLYQLS